MKKIILILFLFNVLYAICTFMLKSTNLYSKVDNHTIILHGFYGDVLIKTFCYIYQTSSISILKDSACSYENSVLYIDDEVCDATEVITL